MTAGECGDPSGDRGDGGDCREAIERLYFFLDGELTDEKRAAISVHLDECHHCLDAYDFEGELRQTIAMKCRDHVPEGLVDRVAEALLRASQDDSVPHSGADA